MCSLVCAWRCPNADDVWLVCADLLREGLIECAVPCPHNNKPCVCRESRADECRVVKREWEEGESELGSYTQTGRAFVCWRFMNVCLSCSHMGVRYDCAAGLR